MEWLKEKISGMVKEWNFSIIFFLISLLVFSQEKKTGVQEKGLSFKTQSLVLIRYNNTESKDIYQKDFELGENTFLYGINGEFNYYFNPHFAAGIGVGLEKISKPSIVYTPLYVNIIGVFNKTQKSLYSKLNFGVHLGNIDNTGFLFRFGLGAKVPFFKKIPLNIEFTYSFQNLNKTFVNSNRPDNFYNLESIGLSIGIEIN